MSKPPPKDTKISWLFGEDHQTLRKCCFSGLRLRPGCLTALKPHHILESIAEGIEEGLPADKLGPWSLVCRASFLNGLQHWDGRIVDRRHVIIFCSTKIVNMYYLCFQFLKITFPFFNCWFCFHRVMGAWDLIFNFNVMYFNKYKIIFYFVHLAWLFAMTSQESWTTDQ